MPEYRERPIIFSTVMIPGLLDGSKTQTRRLVKRAPKGAKKALVGYDSKTLDRLEAIFFPSEDTGVSLGSVFSPYGRRAEKLWVREHWRANRRCDDLPPRDIHRLRDVWYQADGSSTRDLNAKPGRFRHGMFMPRWASRTTLEITDIRIQRLQDITEEDAQAEGAGRGAEMWPEDTSLNGTYRLGFRHLWESIHGKESWTVNPWVWAITFRRVDA